MSASSYVETEEFAQDIAWIKKNHKACELATSKAYKDVGRGALVVKTTKQSELPPKKWTQEMDKLSTLVLEETNEKAKEALLRNIQRRGDQPVAQQRSFSRRH